MKRLVFFILVSFYPVFYFSVNGQELSENDTSLVKIETIDGNEFVGTLISQSDSILIIYTMDMGELRFPVSFIKSQTWINPSKIKDGSFWFDNPQSTRYFFAPNGYGLKKGEAYYQNVWVLINQFAYGITDHISLGGGLIPTFLLGSSSSPVWLTPKISLPVRKDVFNIGAGALIGTVVGENKSGFGIIYGMSTFGNRDTNVTVGAGLAYNGSEGISKYPAINLSAMFRTGPRGYTLFESYYIGSKNEDLVLISFGGRRIVKRTGIDFGFFIPFDSSDSIFILPWLGLTIPFGNREVLESYQYIKK